MIETLRFVPKAEARARAMRRSHSTPSPSCHLPRRHVAGPVDPIATFGHCRVRAAPEPACGGNCARIANPMHITASVFINDDESGLHHDYDAWLDGAGAGWCHMSQYRHNEGDLRSEARRGRAPSLRSGVLRGDRRRAAVEPSNVRNAIMISRSQHAKAAAITHRR